MPKKITPQSFKIFIKNNWLIILLILLTFVLRLIRLEELFYFTYDESIPAFVGRRLFLFHHFPLIGGVTPFGIHLGPYFYWLLSFILILGNLNPISWGIAGALLGSITTLFMYLVGKELGNKRLALVAASLWTFSFLANIYDRHFWALSWGPIGALVTIYCLLKIIKGSKKYFYVLTVFLSFIVHADLSNYTLVFLVFLVLMLNKLLTKRFFILGLMIFLMSFLPLVVFDLKHDFANTKPVLNYLNSDRKSNPEQVVIRNLLILPETMSRLIYSFGDNEISKQYSYCKQYIEEKAQRIPLIFIIISTLVIFAFIIFSSKQIKLNQWSIVGLLIVFYFLGITFYGAILHGPIYEHYITGLFTPFLLIIALLISRFPKLLVFILILIFIYFNTSKLINAQNNMGLSFKREAILYTQTQIGVQPFSLESLSTCWKYNGYRYLFTIANNQPVKSYVDPNLAYLYRDISVWERHPSLVAVFVVHDFQPETEVFNKMYSLFKSHTKSSAQFGSIEVLILDNESGWFDQH